MPKVNAGLHSRFPKNILFEDFSHEDVVHGMGLLKLPMLP